MRVLTFESFDQAGQWGSDGARLASVLTCLGCESFETTPAVTRGPVEQGIDRNCPAFGIRDVVEAGGDLLSAACEFSARQCFQHQRSNQTIPEQGEFFGFGVHAENLRALN